MLPKLITLSRLRAESANAVPCGRMYPRLRTTVAPSDNREFLDRVDKVETVDVEGVETQRSSSGTASRARDAVVLGDGDLERCSGEAMLLTGGLGVDSAIAPVRVQCNAVRVAVVARVGRCSRLSSVRDTPYVSEPDRAHRRSLSGADEVPRCHSGYDVYLKRNVLWIVASRRRRHPRAKGDQTAVCFWLDYRMLELEKLKFS